MKNLKKLLGQRIKELRLKKGLTQEELAEKVEIDQRNLSNIECGNTFPHKSLLKIAEALNVTVQDLFNYEHTALSEKEMRAELAKMLPNLNAQDVKSVYRLVKSML